MQDFFLLLSILFFIWLLHFFWQWPKHQNRFAYLPDEEIVLRLPRIRRRVYYWGRYKMQIMEERIGFILTTQRFLFLHGNYIIQVVDFRKTPTSITFRGPYYFCQLDEVAFVQYATNEKALKIPFKVGNHSAYFELIELPWEKIQKVFPQFSEESSSLSKES